MTEDAGDPDMLVRSFLPRLRKLASSMVKNRPACRRRQDFDEALSAGLGGVMRAIRTYDRSRGVPFESHAFTCARQDIAQGWAEAARAGRRAGVPIEDPGTVPEPDDGAHPALPVGWQVEFDDWLAAITAALPKAHRELIRRHYGRADCRDFGDCARSLSLTTSRARVVEAEAIRRIREALGVAAPDPAAPAAARLEAAFARMRAAGDPVGVNRLRRRASCSTEAAMEFRVAKIAAGEWPGTGGDAHAR